MPHHRSEAGISFLVPAFSQVDLTCSGDGERRDHSNRYLIRPEMSKIRISMNRIANSKKKFIRKYTLIRIPCTDSSSPSVLALHERR